MSDLISRSELIKVLKDRATNEAIMGYMTAYDVTNSIIDEVEEQPTAYSVDKVVEELKQQAEQYRHRGFEAEKKGFSTMADKYYGKQCSYEHAIEIVKAGGNA